MEYPTFNKVHASCYGPANTAYTSNISHLLVFCLLPSKHPGLIVFHDSTMTWDSMVRSVSYSCTEDPENIAHVHPKGHHLQVHEAIL